MGMQAVKTIDIESADMEAERLCCFFDLIAVVFQAVDHRHLTAFQCALLTGNRNGNFAVNNSEYFHISVKMQIIAGTDILLYRKTTRIIPLNLIPVFLVICQVNTPYPIIFIFTSILSPAELLGSLLYQNFLCV